MTDTPDTPPEGLSIAEQIAADRAWMASRAGRAAKGREALMGQGEWPKPGMEGRPAEGEDDDEIEDDDSDEPGDIGEADDKPKRIYRGLRYQMLNDAGEAVWTTLGPVGEDCPVTPLGRDGKIFFFLTKKGQLVSYEDGKFGQAHLEALFADELWWLMQRFPAFNQGGMLTGFKADLARKSLFVSCAKHEVFDPREKVRGLGCWRGPEGELIQHLGNAVLIDGKSHKPGMIGDHVYPGRPKVPAPIMEGGKESAEAILADFQSWSWSRPMLDARLLLGWVGCAVLGGALDWRPMAFMTGDAGTGKSTLQERIKKLLPGRMISTVDATPAALRQIVNQDAIGVSFDEIEADMNSEQATHVMKLARVAASGGEVHRGGKDHGASEFTLRGCFAFSAIVPPSMRAQDMQRMVFLRLQPLKKGVQLGDFSDAQLKEHGQRLVGRLAQGWPRWPATLRSYEKALQGEELGHNQRGAKQFGTLLAVADLLLFDEAPSPEVALNLSRGLSRAELYEYESSDPTWLRIFRHIMSAQPQVWQSSGSPTVAEIVREWLVKEPVNHEEGQRLQKKLNRAGLALVRARNGHVFLAVPARNQQISAMFRDTDYRATGGDGAWTSALRNGEKYEVGRDGKARGVWRSDKVPQLGRDRCMQIWLAATYEANGVMTPIFDADPEAVAEEMAAAEAEAAAMLNRSASPPEPPEPGSEG